MLTLDKVYLAGRVLAGTVKKTDLIYAPAIFPDAEVYLKTENLQKTGSFKLRGSYFRMSAMTKEEKIKGVVACSAGNHAQGVALAAQIFGIKATIFLPATAPISKIEATRQYGAEIKLVDGVYDDAYAAALSFRNETGALFVHPFDDIDVIAGQATVALELIEQLPDMDAVIVPIGGGGLIAGIAYAIKTIKPTCKVYGVQAAGAASMHKSILDKNCTTLCSVCTFADGTAVKKPSQLTFDMCQQYVDKIITVSEDEIAAAVLALIEQHKLIAEGAGALSVAAAMFGNLPIKNKKVTAVVSGGNIDVNILSRVINRGLLTSGRLTNLIIELVDKPGQLKTVSAIIADMGANVISVQYTQGGANMDINGCFLNISMETRNHAHLDEIREALISEGFKLCG